MQTNFKGFFEEFVGSSHVSITFWTAFGLWVQKQARAIGSVKDKELDLKKNNLNFLEAEHFSALSQKGKTDRTKSQIAMESL